MTMVNGERRDSIYSVIQTQKKSFDSIDPTEKILDSFKFKDAKSKYNNYLLKFTNNLIRLSLNLKQLNINERDEKLRKQLSTIHQWIEDLREQESNCPNQIQKDLFEGIIFPFGDYSNQIIGVISSEGFVYNTRKRTPYRIIFETIEIFSSFRDLKQYKKKFQSKLSLPLEEQIEQIELQPASYNNLNSICNNILEEDQSPFDILIDNKLDAQEEFNNKIYKYQGLDKFAKKVKKEETLRWFTKLEPTKKIKKYIKPAFLKKKSEELKQTPYQQDQQKLQSIYQQNTIAQRIVKFDQLFKSNAQPVRTVSHDSKINNIFLNPKLFKTRSQRNVPGAISLEFLNELQVYLSKQSEQKKLKEIKAKILNQQRLQQKENSTLSEIFNSGFRQKKTEIIRNFGIWGDLWEDKMKVLRKRSLYGHFPSYMTRTFIVKAADDLRLELIAMQLIKKFQSIFAEAKLRLYLRPYEIIVTSPNSGLIGQKSSSFIITDRVHTQYKIN